MPEATCPWGTRYRVHIVLMWFCLMNLGCSTTAEDILPNERTLLLDTRFIQLTSGSQALRWWCGELGCGHTIIEVQGRLTDANTGDVFAAFADKRRGAAVIDPTGGSGEDLLREDMLGIVRDVAAALR